MNPAYELHREPPELDSPVLVVMLVGWIDTSGSAAAAMSAIEAETDATTLATFDADAFIDRPVACRPDWIAGTFS